MGSKGVTHKCSASTCCKPPSEKISRPPEGSNTARAKRGRWKGWPSLRRDKPITVRLVYRGGPNGWLEVDARGQKNFYTWCDSLGQVWKDITQN